MPRRVQRTKQSRRTANQIATVAPAKDVQADGGASRPHSPRSAAEFAQLIGRAWQGHLEKRLETGRLLLEAKASLRRGEFLTMLAKSLPFDRTTAFRPMKVAAHPDLHVAHWATYPASYRTRYELTKIPRADLGRLVADGKITPSLARQEAVQLARQYSRPMPERETAKPFEGCTVDDLDALVTAGAQFGTIYADPPWSYDNEGTRAAASNHYPTMSIEAMAALPIAGLAAPSAHCHIWATNAFFTAAQHLLEAWGFQYKSCFVWTKPQLGIGNYWRVSHEFLLLGVRGSCQFRDRGQRSWLTAARTKHSQKPEEVRALVEKVSPGPYLELFARRVVPGWSVWGNEIPRAAMEPRAERLAS